MKHGGPYMTGDCVRSIKAIASADGRLLYIAPYEGQKKEAPPCGNHGETKGRTKCTPS